MKIILAIKEVFPDLTDEQIHNQLVSLAKFCDKVAQSDSSDCLIWLGACTGEGYGRFKNMTAHRAAWEFANQQKQPSETIIRHTCDNRACVNPNHLFLVETKPDTFRMILNSCFSTLRGIGVKLNSDTQDKLLQDLEKLIDKYTKEDDK